MRMKYTYKIVAMVFFFETCFAHQGNTIKHIFVDINALITTSPTAASKVVGIINSMKYTARFGHIPCKADFFKILKHVPSISHQHTYNEDLMMPSIFSDWFLGLQSNHAIRAIIHQYLDASHYSDIEKTIFKNISSMMLNPVIFMDTQYVVKEISKLLYLLKKSGYTIYLIGNLDKESEVTLMKLLQGHGLPDVQHCYFSHKAKQLKPTAEYFTALLSYFNLNKSECLIIDIEKNHVQVARHQGFATVLLHNHHAGQLKSELIRVGIRV